MFWKKKKPPVPPNPNTNRLDDLANQLQQQGRIDELETELLKLDIETLSGVEKETWHHLFGIIPFQAGNRQLAFERFTHGVNQCPESGYLHFALGQEHEFRGETERMFECFDKSVYPRIPASYALAAARYSYLWSRTDKAWSYVVPIMDTYFDLKILDSNFLFLRQLPFFEQTWNYLAAFSLLDGDFERLESLTRQAETTCKEFDFISLRAELAGYQSGDFTSVKEKLRQTIKESSNSGHPIGHNVMQLNVILAQETDEVEHANRLLDSVALTSDDHPWLDDIRLLAKCERASHRGNMAEEADLLKQFVSRQPMLFEPDHALNFNLLSYQERLKPDYQRSRNSS